MFKQLTVFISLIITTIPVWATDTTEKNVQTVLPEYVFKSSNIVMKQVDETLLLAQKNKQKALLVIGAQWCHDSRGLARNFSTTEMQRIITSKYQTLFIDAGYLDKGFDVVKRFGQPVYYGTPTVLIIDPVTETILNRDSMQKWLNADAIKLNEYIDYFGQFTNDKIFSDNKSTLLAQYLNDIEQFEQTQAIRLSNAYKVLGPLLKAYMQSDKKDASDEFANMWEEVRVMRYNIQSDLKALKEEAETNANKNISLPLSLPSYPAFSWETKA